MVLILMPVALRYTTDGKVIRQIISHLYTLDEGSSI